MSRQGLIGQAALGDHLSLTTRSTTRSRNELPRVAINGFGRIGRALFRAYVSRELRAEPLPFELVQVNDCNAATQLQHLLKYDSTYGPASPEILSAFNQLALTRSEQIEETVWQDIDYLLECTGSHRTPAQLKHHLQQGASRVLLSAPPKQPLERMVVYGVNHTDLHPSDRLVSNASCSTNAAAVALSVLSQLSLQPEQVWINEIHGYTIGQTLLDSAHEDPRRARSATQNIIPTPTLGLDVLGQIMPTLQGRVESTSIRVPVSIGACLHLTVQLPQSCSVETLNAYFAQAHQQQPSLLGYCDEPLVSSDFIQRSESAIFDATQTRSMGKTVKMVVWFDNEWGYSNRLLDLLTFWISLNQ